MSEQLHSLVATVQRNCDISDAHHARNYTLCIYLLKMREYFRWEKGYGFGDSLPNSELGDWLTAREQLWQELEGNDFEPIPVDGDHHQPFEADRINRRLLPRGLVYSGGIGGFARAHFFLAKLHRQEQRDGCDILIAGEEFARDLTAPPAMSLGNTIFVRRQSIRRMLWEKVEEWRWNEAESPMSRAMAFYPFDEDLDTALEAMTEVELEAVVLHEMGESRAGVLLGTHWERLLEATLQSRSELVLRAARDHLADCAVTLPQLIREERVPSLHFYFANLAGMRKEIFPSLAEAYRIWCERNDLSVMRRVVEKGERHWRRLAEELAQLRSDDKEDLKHAIEERLEKAPL